jgi:hypothetical protein
VSTSSPVPAASQLRGEIENVLARKIDGVTVAGTVTWLTTELGGSGKGALDAVGTELIRMQQDGLVTVRQLKSGEWLWKLTDKHFTKWQALAGPQANLNPSRRSN